MKKNLIAGYRTMLGMTQIDMANEFEITRQSYALKEKGEIKFSDEEKLKFKNLLTPIFPDIKIDDIFFSQSAKKYKEKVVNKA